MSVLIATLAGIALGVAKGVQLQKQLSSRSYSWGKLALICLAWSALVLPSIRSACSTIACQWSMNFGWWTTLVPLLSSSNATGSAAKVTMTLAGILSVYVFAHVLAWMLYGARRLFQIVASL